MGIFGAAANGLILYALIASKQHKRHPLIVNQNVLDVFGCVMIIVTYALKISDLYLTGSLGYWLCVMIVGENLLWCALEGSVFSLAIITIDRYLKVVHPSWSKKHLRRKWVTYCLVAFPWIGAVVFNMAVTFKTSAVIDGICLAYVLWEDRTAEIAHGIWYFVFFYAGILVILILCYWRILAVIRRQAQVMASHNAAGTSQPSTTRTQAKNRAQSNVIKRIKRELHFTHSKPFWRIVLPVLYAVQYGISKPVDWNDQTKV